MKLTLRREGSENRQGVKTMALAVNRSQEFTELQASEGRFRSIFERTIISMGLLSPEGTILFVNPGFASLLGWTREELSGRRLMDFVVAEDIVGFRVPPPPHLGRGRVGHADDFPAERSGGGSGRISCSWLTISSTANARRPSAQDCRKGWLKAKK